MTPALFMMIVVFPAAMAYAAASDLVSMTISNRLCLVLSKPWCCLKARWR